VAVSLLAGHAVGVDASVLLYKLVVGNLQMLRSCRERRYVSVAKALADRMLRLVEHGVTPIVVFDGQARYPAKGGEHAERAGRRAAAEARIAAGAVPAADEQRVLAAAFAPTWDLVQQVMATLHELGLCAIVAPMEADAQLAFLDRFGFTGYTMSTDNDLVVHGCRRVIFDWDWAKMTGRAFALDSIVVKRGTFTEVFATDSGARCTFTEMLPSSSTSRRSRAFSAVSISSSRRVPDAASTVASASCDAPTIDTSSAACAASAEADNLRSAVCGVDAGTAEGEYRPATPPAPDAGAGTKANEAWPSPRTGCSRAPAAPRTIRSPGSKCPRATKTLFGFTIPSTILASNSTFWRCVQPKAL
jgi:hypothetical protein